jgi:hypothetical protein
MTAERLQTLEERHDTDAGLSHADVWELLVEVRALTEEIERLKDTIDAMKTQIKYETSGTSGFKGKVEPL